MQIRRRYLNDMNNEQEEPMKIIYDLFEVPMPLVTVDDKQKKFYESKCGRLGPKFNPF